MKVEAILKVVILFENIVQLLKGTEMTPYAIFVVYTTRKNKNSDGNFRHKSVTNYV